MAFVDVVITDYSPGFVRTVGSISTSHQMQSSYLSVVFPTKLDKSVFSFSLVCLLRHFICTADSVDVHHSGLPLVLLALI